MWYCVEATRHTERLEWRSSGHSVADLSTVIPHGHSRDRAIRLPVDKHLVLSGGLAGWIPTHCLCALKPVAVVRQGVSSSSLSTELRET